MGWSLICLVSSQPSLIGEFSNGGGRVGVGGVGAFLLCGLSSEWLVDQDGV